jgi:TetR/AcrR family transcriptional regulator, regulator of cefoperazone and chloramphenicol sensitivity
MNTFFVETPSMPHVDLRRQRGRRTQERLILAALKLFGAHGYKAVTTRTIAHEAHANQASIRYHFGGKCQLYQTVADRVASDARAALQPSLRKARTEDVGIEGRRASLIEIIRAFTRHLCSYSDRGAAASFIARELAHPGSGYTRIYEEFIRDVHAEVTSLVARTTARHTRAQGAIIDAHALMGAALSFTAAREAFKQRSFRPVNREERIDEIAERIAKITTCVIERRPARAPSRPLS